MEERERIKARIGRLRASLEKSLTGWVDYLAQPEDLGGLSGTKVVLGFRAIIDGAEVSSEIWGVFNVALEKRPEAQELWDKLQKAQAELKALKPEAKPKRVDLPSSSFSTIRWGEVYPDRVEIWHRNITGARRDPQAILDKVLSRDEFRALYKKEWAQEKARMAQKRTEEEEEKRREQAWEAWVKTLPTDLGDGWVRIGSGIYDEYGNYCFPIPSEPISNFQAWLEKEITEFLESGE